MMKHIVRLSTGCGIGVIARGFFVLARRLELSTRIVDQSQPYGPNRKAARLGTGADFPKGKNRIMSLQSAIGLALLLRWEYDHPLVKRTHCRI